MESRMLMWYMDQERVMKEEVKIVIMHMKLREVMNILDVAADQIMVSGLVGG